MDIFKFKNPGHPILMEQGEIINNIKSKMWVERYRDVGSFELVSNIEYGLKTILPVGSFISHIESTDIMVVENHEITEDRGKPTYIKITGRSFDSFLENRIVGSNKGWPTIASAQEDFLLVADFTWDQAVLLIKEHISRDYLDVGNWSDELYFVTTLTDITHGGDFFERVIKRGTLHNRVIEILELDNLGIKTIRPGSRSVLGFSNANIALFIHEGQDLSKDVIFSHSTGEIESADYLWSNKLVKNAALVTGRWLETVVPGTQTEYNKRMLFVDASDIDSSYSTAPTGTERDTVLFYMQLRGQEAIAAQKEIAIIKAEPTKNSMAYKYREDYDVGDIITVSGEYSETAKMRVTEYVEVEDENGENGYPTLSVVL